MTASASDHAAITELVARFDDAVNRRDVGEFATLWADDAVWELMKLSRLGSKCYWGLSGYFAAALLVCWRLMVTWLQGAGPVWKRERLRMGRATITAQSTKTFMCDVLAAGGSRSAVMCTSGCHLKLCPARPYHW
jgi:SnoaL-like domain